MRDAYAEQQSDRALCFFCDYWWAILLFLLAIGAGVYFRDQWLPLISEAPFAPEPTLGTGDIQVTLTWNSTNDIDLWVTDPAGELIFFDHRFSISGGVLDVDANADCQILTSRPVENIYWPPGDAPIGSYTVQANYYRQCENTASVPYHVRLKVDGEVMEFDGVLSAEGETLLITTFSR